MLLAYAPVLQFEYVINVNQSGPPHIVLQLCIRCRKNTPHKMPSAQVETDWPALAGHIEQNPTLSQKGSLIWRESKQRTASVGTRTAVECPP